MKQYDYGVVDQVYVPCVGCGHKIYLLHIFTSVFPVSIGYSSNRLTLVLSLKCTTCSRDNNSSIINCRIPIRNDHCANIQNLVDRAIHHMRDKHAPSGVCLCWSYQAIDVYPSPPRHRMTAAALPEDCIVDDIGTIKADVKTKSTILGGQLNMSVMLQATREFPSVINPGRFYTWFHTTFPAMTLPPPDHFYEWYSKTYCKNDRQLHNKMFLMDFHERNPTVPPIDDCTQYTQAGVASVSQHLRKIVEERIHQQAVKDAETAADTWLGDLSGVKAGDVITFDTEKDGHTVALRDTDVPHLWHTAWAKGSVNLTTAQLIEHLYKAGVEEWALIDFDPAAS